MIYLEKLKFKNAILFSFLLIISSCKFNQSYFPNNEGKQIIYEVFFKDKENKKSNFRQSFYFLPRMKNAIPVLKNDGNLIFYIINENGIVKKTMDEFLSTQVNNTQSKMNEDLLIAFPISKGTEWETNDKTTLQMKLGYDRIYDTNLPFRSKNKITEVNQTITIKGKKIKNCIKVSSYGKTSYNPGPPLDNINIEVFSTSWFAKDYGLIKYKREEKSDSETMGEIIYEKTMLIND
ncbi:MAG: hypothetical protein ACJ0G4_03100 [Alphaproteobacteria bacterium]